MNQPRPAAISRIDQRGIIIFLVSFVLYASGGVAMIFYADQAMIAPKIGIPQSVANIILVPLLYVSALWLSEKLLRILDGGIHA